MKEFEYGVGVHPPVRVAKLTGLEIEQIIVLAKDLAHREAVNQIWLERFGEVPEDEIAKATEVESKLREFLNKLGGVE